VPPVSRDVTQAPFGGGLVAPKHAAPWLRRICQRINDAVVDIAFCPQLNDFRRRKLHLPPVSRVYDR